MNPPAILPDHQASGRFRRLVAAALLALMTIGPGTIVRAQDAAPGRAFALVVSDWQRTFDSVERSTGDRQLDESQRRRWDALLAAVIEDARAFENDARREIEAQTRLLEALGTPPAEGQSPEPRDVARERKDISDVIGLYRSRLAQTELAITRAAALQEQLASAVRQRFLQRLLQREPSPLAPGVFAAGVAAAADRLMQIAAAPLDAWAALAEDQRARLRWLLPLTLLAGVGTAVMLWGMLTGRASRRLAAGRPSPSDARRLTVVALRSIAGGFLPAAALSVPVLVLWGAADLPATAPSADVVSSALLGIVAFVVGIAVARAALAPPEVDAGLSPLAPAAARDLCRCIGFLGFVFIVDLTLRRMAASLPPAQPPLNALDGLIYCGLAALGLLLAARGRVWRTQTAAGIDPTAGGQSGRCHEAGAAAEPGAAGVTAAATAIDEPALRSDAVDRTDGHRQPLDPAKTVARIAALAAVLATIAAAIGQTRLAVTVVDTLLWSAVAVALCLLARTAGRAMIAALLATALLRPDGGLTATTARGVLAAARVLLDPLLAAIAVWAMAPLWGLAREDLARWARGVLEGFTIGGVTISLVALALAAVVLVVALAAARSARRALSDRLLPRTRLDAGVQNSISVGAGYAGVVAAVLLAISVLGVDLSSLAIVAGALSVGIGFGLQNIVNNFVSGLILLIERPVKVGDWVVVGDQQGFVRRINVRSTELETFERASVILPNSDLLSNALVNWTHKNRIGRVDVRIGVDYGVDTEKVREVLLACARAHAEVMAWPQPFVLFLDFADSSLVFELRAFLRDVEKRLRVASDLRFAIEKACRKAGIAFPYPQSDIHLRDIDRLEKALSALATRPELPTDERGRTPGSMLDESSRE
ncbi:MAG: DUF3772 domain-containing protein [Rhodospirillales bacterium]|nr:DUF3772 domain-containing protein [Rhodospirillales bacterium]